MPNGCVINIVKKGNTHYFTPLNIYKYKEEITRTKYPIDITLKGNNDIIQTITSSVLLNNSYNWLICEGTSDKIYLEEYLKKEITDKKLRIIPVGGCSFIIKIYKQLALLLTEINIDTIKGKIFLLVDTDHTKYKEPDLPKSVMNYDQNNKIRLRRLVNLKTTPITVLKPICNDENEPTDMEGVLNGKAFNNVIISNFKDELPFIKKEEMPEIPSAFVFSEKSEKDTLQAFFTSQNKVRFARAYVEELQKGNYKVPNWITEIKKFFNS